MDISNISIALLAYSEKNMLPKIPQTFNRWLTYAGLLAKMPNIEKTIQQNIPMLKDMGIIDDNNNIDFTKIRNLGNAAFEKVPVINIADFDFNCKDFEEFLNFLES